jgi:hypothetical protein
MGRRQSLEHRQAVTADWRRRLLRIAWGKTSVVLEARQFAGMLRVSYDEADPGLRRRWEKAAKEVRAVVPAVGEVPDRPDALDEWIERHFVRRGEDLLVPPDVRRAALAHARDVHRRQARADQEIRSARIEMRADAWATLEAIRTRLQAHGPRKLSLGAALEKIITAYDEKTQPPVARKRSDLTRQGAGPEGDLFAGLGSDEPSR